MPPYVYTVDPTRLHIATCNTILHHLAAEPDTWHTIGCLRDLRDQPIPNTELDPALTDLKAWGSIEAGHDKACIDRCPPQDAWRITPRGIRVAVSTRTHHGEYRPLEDTTE